MANLSTLVDRFSGSAINQSVWSPQGVCSQLDGFIMPVSGTEANHVLTDNLYTFDEVTVNFARLPNRGNGTTTAAIELVAEGYTAQAGVIWNNGFIQLMLDFAWDTAVAIPVTHTWFKMARSGGQFIGYTSADGVTWAEFDRFTAPAWMSANVLFRITPGYYGAETDAGICIVGGVNVSPQTASVGPMINDLMYTKLGALEYSGSITDRFMKWRGNNGYLSWAAYMTAVMAATDAAAFCDAEIEFWTEFV